MSEIDSTTTPKVEYRDVLGFPGYRVGNDGSVWSFHKRGGNKLTQKFKWRKLKLATERKGHKRVNLVREGGFSYKTVRVHILVLVAFVSPRPNGMHGCHNNGNPADNRVENLRWDTHVNNQADRLQHGTLFLGERNPMAKLSRESVLKIVEMRKSGHKDSAIARHFRVSQSVICNIFSGVAWYHVTGIIPKKSLVLKRPTRLVNINRMSQS